MTSKKKLEQPQSIIINALKSWIIYYRDWYDVVVGWMKARREGGRGLDPGGHDDAAVVGVGFQRVDNLLQLVNPWEEKQRKQNECMRKRTEKLIQ